MAFSEEVKKAMVDYKPVIKRIKKKILERAALGCLYLEYDLPKVPMERVKAIAEALKAEVGEGFSVSATDGVEYPAWGMSTDPRHHIEISFYGLKDD